LPEVQNAPENNDPPTEVKNVDVESGTDSAPEVSLSDLQSKIETLSTELGDWKKKSRHFERQAKKNPSRTENEGASPDDSDSRNDVRDVLIRDRAEMRFEAEAESRGLDVDSVLRHVNLDSFIQDGAVLKADIKAYVEQMAPKPAPKQEPKFKQGLGIGPQAGGSNQLGQAEMDRMSPAEIVKAHNEGRFDALLGKKR